MDQLDEQVSRHKGSITSPFKKPSVPSNFSTGGRLPTEDDHLECLLEQINRSEAVHEEQLRGKIHLLESEKLQLQEILARANLRIEILER